MGVLKNPTKKSSQATERLTLALIYFCITAVVRVFVAVRNVIMSGERILRRLTEKKTDI